MSTFNSSRRFPSRPARRWLAPGVLVRALTLGAATFLLAVQANAQTHYRVESGAIVVTCPMTVGGSFEAKTSAVSGGFDRTAEGAISGSLMVDLTTLDTGIDLRNRHLRENYLEVEKGDGFAAATLTELALDGAAAASASGEATFTAKLQIHGVTQPVSGKATLTPTAGGVQVTASFPVNIPDYDIKKPRHLGIGVKDTISITVDAFLAIEANPADGGHS